MITLRQIENEKKIWSILHRVYTEIVYLRLHETCHKDIQGLHLTLVFDLLAHI